MPTPVITHDQLGWAWQTGYTNRVKRPSSFMKQLIFGGRTETLPTESVELSFREGERLLAPFVEINAEAIPVGSRSTTFANVSTPNIRIKRPMEAYNVMNRRLPGTGIFVSGGGQISAARQQAIQEDLEYMVDLIENREEWMVCELVTSATAGFMELEYQVTERANWKLSIPRSTDMDFTPTVKWDAASDVDILGDVQTVKRLFSKHINSPLQRVVMGSAAANSFINDAAVKTLLDQRNVAAGSMTLTGQYNESGAIYYGSIFGVEFWEYAREYVTDAGAPAQFIPADTVVWIAGGNALSDSRMLYGAIPDHGAFDAGNFVGQRFAKSWQEEDPSIRVQLLQSRPLPYIRQPNAIAVTADVNT